MSTFFWLFRSQWQEIEAKSSATWLFIKQQRRTNGTEETQNSENSHEVEARLEWHCHYRRTVIERKTEGTSHFKDTGYTGHEITFKVEARLG